MLKIIAGNKNMLKLFVCKFWKLILFTSHTKHINNKKGIMRICILWKEVTFFKKFNFSSYNKPANNRIKKSDINNSPNQNNKEKKENNIKVVTDLILKFSIFKKFLILMK